MSSITQPVDYESPPWYFSDTLARYLNREGVARQWTSITISDQLYPEYYYSSVLLQKEGKALLVDSTGVTQASVSMDAVNELLAKLFIEIKQADSAYLHVSGEEDPLDQYQLDSNWFKTHIGSIWCDYQGLHHPELNEEQLQIASELLADYTGLYRVLKTPNNWNPGTQVCFNFIVAFPFDTLQIQATSSFVYSLPWYYFNNQTRLQNSSISVLVADLMHLMGLETKNSESLAGVGFEQALMNDIYQRYLRFKLE